MEEKTNYEWTLILPMVLTSCSRSIPVIEYGHIAQKRKSERVDLTL